MLKFFSLQLNILIDKIKMKPMAALDIFSGKRGDIKDVIQNNINDYETKYSC